MLMDYQKTFSDLKKQILSKEFSCMNDMQKRAIFAVDGPILILAGAGSGKTTVMVNRVAYMVNFGDSYSKNFLPENISDDDIRFLSEYNSGINEDRDRMISLLSFNPVLPWNILAITFTNKAANELKERLGNMLGEAALDVNAGTFHSICVRILRREIDRIGYERSFTIYDTDDSVRVIKDVLKELDIENKNFPPKSILSEISCSKDKGLSPIEYQQTAGEDYRRQVIGKVYERYQNKLKSANAVDFDDIILLTVDIFEKFPEVLAYYQNKFKYIMVDEYQDTNNTQYRLVSLLSESHKNICVVGDDDQSIYRFRGATIENILSFENQFDNALVIRLEQNYRSTQNILDAANSVIKNNPLRKGKNLWTSNKGGDNILVFRARDEVSEANFVADSILKNVASGERFSDNAVLYRMGAQSNAVEKSFIKSGISYKIFGGTKFFERKEVKDVISYMSVVNNTADAVRLKRIINEPKRGIGPGTVKHAEDIAEGLGITLFEVIKHADTYSVLSKKSKPLMEFAQMIENLIDFEAENDLEDFYNELLEQTGYSLYLVSLGDEGKTRLENIDELKSNIIKHMEENENASLASFLEEVALYTDLDSMNNDEDYVMMMTIHSAKGLEFDNVFVVGMEEGVFPSRLSLNSLEELEEERRLAYVAITRAKKTLTLSSTDTRVLYGQTSRNTQSRFLGEIPSELCEFKNDKPKIEPRGFYSNSKTSSASAFSNPKPQTAVIDYSIGDTVAHKTFGNGKVVNMTNMANDIMVEVNFDKVGVKKIMANFAKLKKV